jgi:hypothetical protein
LNLTNKKFTYCSCYHFESPIHILSQELTNPFSCATETSMCIMNDFKSKRLYLPMHNGLYVEVASDRSPFLIFCNIITKVSRSVGYYSSLYIYSNPKLLCMNVIWFQITLGCKPISQTCLSQLFIWTWNSWLLECCFEEVHGLWIIIVFLHNLMGCERFGEN